MQRVPLLVTAALVLFGAATTSPNLLPNGWVLLPPDGAIVRIGTMPQGAAVSPDGSRIAVVESGFNPPALALYATRDLRLIKRFALAGAAGRPIWTPSGILVAGANADAIFAIDPRGRATRTIRLARGTYPVAVAASHGLVAVSSDGDDSVRIARFAALGAARPIRVGAQLGNITFSPDATTAYVAVRSGSSIAAIDARTGVVRRIATGLHPSDVLARGPNLWVAESDADRVGEYDAATGKRRADIFVGALRGATGSSPNALAAGNGSLYVSLGAANQIAVIRGGRVIARLAAGWYPTDVATIENRLLVIDGKGEGTKPNPDFDVMSRSNRGYIGATEYGSIRALALDGTTPSVAPPGPPGLDSAAPDTVVRAGGPIRHVFFIIKENRTYDQILGDMPGGDGDPKLVWFGARVTPNQHAIAARFGLFDDYYTSGEVSDPGHNWDDGAFANDYVERIWPMAYGGRLDDDRVLTGIGAAVPARGYMWDAARRAGVSFRDYGEMALMPPVDGHVASTAPSLRGRFDPHYVGWNLNYSDLDRVKEWRREFDAFLATDSMPQLEYMWLPNDHTAGTRPGRLTPAAYIATNDFAVGQIIDAISHSKLWASSAVFITEDDAQDGADHVSDQRSTLYIASPYARGGVVHEHLSTVSVLRTIELLLGIAPLSIYDATAQPLYSAFVSNPNLAPFDVIAPKIDLTSRNSKVAYGSQLSARLDLSRPDAAAPGVLRDILAHAH